MRTDIAALVVALIAILTLAWWSGNESAEEGVYCDMRQLWEETDGQAGWPEYVEGKDEECGYED